MPWPTRKELGERLKKLETEILEAKYQLHRSAEVEARLKQLELEVAQIKQELFTKTTLKNQPGDIT